MRVVRMNHAISVIEDELIITITAKLVSKIDNSIFQNPILSLLTLFIIFLKMFSNAGTFIFF